MDRPAQLLALAIPLALGLQGCDDACKTPLDCASGEICYQGVCRIATLENQTCNVDTDCGPEPPPGQARALVCIASRCRVVVTMAPPVCGNNRIEAGEVCDDGNVNSGDGCEANCTLTPADGGFPDAMMTPEAGPMDAMVADTGTVGMDAMVADTGTVTDAGMADTGTVADGG
jgi:cysteine-rich repeat protein